MYVPLSQSTMSYNVTMKAPPKDELSESSKLPTGSMATAGWILALAGVFTALSCSLAARPTSSSSTSLDCPTVTSLLADCGAFVTHGAAAWPLPAPGTPCCAGVTQLYAVAADSADNWLSVCVCMVGLVRRYSSNASAIALLPVVCGVLPGRHTVDSLTYCTSPP